MAYSPFFLRIKNLEKEERKAYTMWIFTLWAVVFFGLFAIRPSLVVAGTLNLKLKEYSQIETRLKEKISNLMQAQENYSKVKDKIPALLGKIPDTKSEQGFIREVSLIAGKNKSQVTLLTFGSEIPLREQEGLTSLPFSLQIQGKVENLEQFLSMLENTNRLTVIEIASLNKSSGDYYLLVLSGKIFFEEND